MSQADAEMDVLSQARGVLDAGSSDIAAEDETDWSRRFFLRAQSEVNRVVLEGVFRSLVSEAMLDISSALGEQIPSMFGDDGKDATLKMNSNSAESANSAEER